MDFIWPHLSKDLIHRSIVYSGYLFIDYPEAGQGPIAGHKHKIQEQ